MRFSVCHQSLYRYSLPIRLGTHVVRLSPRLDNAAAVQRSLIVDPLPSFRDDGFDRFGNPVTTLDFTGYTDHLRIESRFEVETFVPVSPAGFTFPPLPWPAPAEPWLADYLVGEPVAPSVQDFALSLAQDVGWGAVAFLEHMNRTLFTRTDRHIRVDGSAQDPAHTLASAKGACRDLTVLFMAACRWMGIPARFVSGYQAQAESVDGRRHLHAWPEVFLPGFGWAGFDPTHGLPVTDGHVPLCAAPGQAATMPIEGGFWFDGTEITSTLDYTVEIDTRA